MPLGREYDVVALILPKSQWLSEKYWGFKLLGRKVPVITITADENEVWQTKELKEYVTVFEEGMSHELAHYYGLTPDIVDATHTLVAMHGIGNWVPHFLKQWTPPPPRESEETGKLRPFIGDPNGFAFDMGLTEGRRGGG
jgi:hypothetical protein